MYRYIYRYISVYIGLYRYIYIYIGIYKYINLSHLVWCVQFFFDISRNVMVYHQVHDVWVCLNTFRRAPGCSFDAGI